MMDGWMDTNGANSPKGRKAPTVRSTHVALLEGNSHPFVTHPPSQPASHWPWEAGTETARELAPSHAETDGRADGEREGGGEEETACTHTSGSPGDRGQGQGDRTPPTQVLKPNKKRNRSGRRREGRREALLSPSQKQTDAKTNQQKGPGMGAGSPTVSSPPPPPQTQTDKRTDRPEPRRPREGAGAAPPPAPRRSVQSLGRGGGAGQGGGSLPGTGRSDPHAGPRLRPARQTDRRTMDPGVAARATPGPGPLRAGAGAGRALAGPCAGILRAALQTDKASGRQTDRGGKRWRRERRERAARAPASGEGGKARARAGAAGAASPPPSSPLAAAAGSSSSPSPRAGPGRASLQSPPPPPAGTPSGLQASPLLHRQV
ncbi:basic salivary proline-rich protein 4-like [Vombatus ursinus]|uniref:basic salivary proline-rich protein 4-like n=1 Tax=Vombatus ursinus TaxID=29139 RepID=UPI000FFCFA89|nr:basic salivary proline-rich protein 4-like [Vombatus ursinus]